MYFISGLHLPFLSPSLYSYRLVLWVQGEADMNEGYRKRRNEYACLLKAMAEQWRAVLLSPDLPFIVHQLHSCDGGNDGQVYPGWSNYGDLRMAQQDTATWSRNVSLAVTYDR